MPLQDVDVIVSARQTVADWYMDGLQDLIDRGEVQLHALMIGKHRHGKCFQLFSKNSKTQNKGTS